MPQPIPNRESVPQQGLADRSRIRRVSVIALTAAAACWGVGTVVTKQVVDAVAPLTLLPLQLAASCVFLVAAAGVRRERPAWDPPMRRLAALGLLNPGAAYALGLIGLTTITASMSVLLWALEPVLILLLAALLLREHVSARLGASVAVAMVGVLLVVYQPGAAGAPVGIVLTLVAVACCALYTVITRKLVLDDSSLMIVLAQQATALAFAVVIATVVGAAGGTGWSFAGMDAAAWLAAAASGVLYYGLAFWLFVTGLRHVPASYAGAFLPLIPVAGLSAGYLVGERLEPRQWLGAAVIVVATAVLALSQRHERRCRRADRPRLAVCLSRPRTRRSSCRSSGSACR
ncbi:DMT family transporter [Nocardioides caldifontis]|uniref:DMT family transporter n=1 Tax=Nocardioides caldifontis TaxID=2588938 RepID=UPI0011DF207A|nr:DMT family transporter [Nocardioides caldifontis]